MLKEFVFFAMKGEIGLFRPNGADIVFHHGFPFCYADLDELKAAVFYPSANEDNTPPDPMPRVSLVTLFSV
jgi:hypothetical protein